MLEDHRVEEDKDTLGALMDDICGEFERGNDFHDAPVNVVDVDADGAAKSDEQSMKKMNKNNCNNGFANSNNFSKSAKFINTVYVNAFC